MKKILVISSKPPYPIIDGGCYASAQLLDNLVKTDASIKFITISTKKHPFELDCFPQKIVDNTVPEDVFINTKVTIPSAAAHLFKKGSYNVSRFHSDEMKKRVKELLEEGFDCVLLDGLFTTTYIKTIRKNSTARIILRTHNLESDLWDAYAENEKNALKKRYLLRLAKDIRVYENDVLNKVDQIMTISPDDATKMKQVAPSVPIDVLPVAIKVFHKTTDYGNDGFFHIGSMNWQPNIEAVEELIQLASKLDSDKTRIRLAGSGMNEWKMNVPPFVEKVGFVEDPALFAVNSGILVSPIRSGSGVRIKILEMLAAGVPVITTSKGAEGLFKKDMLLIGDTEEELIVNMKDLSSDEEKRKSLGSKGVKYIEEFHDPSKIIAQLSALINE